MRTFKQLAGWLKDSKGVATSLIEATATVAIGAVLAGVAVGGAIDAINDSKIQAAASDVSSIGEGMITFYTDNAFFPLFKDGQKTGSGDSFFQDLVSENGTYPSDSSGVAGVNGGQGFWNIPSSTTAWATTGFFGHMPDYNIHDSIEGHLIKNILGNNTAKSYPLRGTYAGDPQRGWAGPYIARLPKTDPWGNKYLINIRELHAGHLLDPAFSTIHGGGPGNLPKIAVIVISAGPNRTLETSAEQHFDAFAAGGDDIVFRIK
jgi:type II secretory pathway pseudopilin PulG